MDAYTVNGVPHQIVIKDKVLLWGERRDKIQYPNPSAQLAQLDMSISYRSVVRRLKSYLSNEVEGLSLKSPQEMKKCLGCFVLEAYNGDKQNEQVTQHLNFLLFVDADKPLYEHTPAGVPCVECGGILPLGKHPITGAVLTRLNL